MTGYVSRATAETRRMRNLLRGLLWLVCCGLSVVCWAGRPVRVYEVDLRGGQTPAALQDAMREALVRATGRRESANDPAFASLIANAPSYVKSYASGPRGESQVVFDSTKVETAIMEAGRVAWDQNRPFTLVVLSPTPARAVQDAARLTLDQVAMQRGLPITLVPLAIADANGTELDRDALMQLAQRYGGDAVLVGKGDPSIADAPLQWTLYTNFSSQSWSGSLQAGIDGTVNDLAPPPGASLAEAEATTLVRIEGVSNLNDYAAIERLLQSMPGARRANLVEVSGSSASFSVTVRGGTEAIDHALTGSGRFVRSGASNSGLVFQYRPQ